MHSNDDVADTGRPADVTKPASESERPAEPSFESSSWRRRYRNSLASLWDRSPQSVVAICAALVAIAALWVSIASWYQARRSANASERSAISAERVAQIHESRVSVWLQFVLDRDSAGRRVVRVINRGRPVTIEAISVLYDPRIDADKGSYSRREISHRMSSADGVLELPLILGEAATKAIPLFDSFVAQVQNPNDLEPDSRQSAAWLEGVYRRIDGTPLRNPRGAVPYDTLAVAARDLDGGLLIRAGTQVKALGMLVHLSTGQHHYCSIDQIRDSVVLDEFKPGDK